MKCINRKFIRAISIITCLVFITGCGGSRIDLSYEEINGINADRFDNKASSFASNLAVTNKDVSAANGATVEEQSAGGLFDVNKKQVLYAQNIHEQLYPASLTKVLTAYIALKYTNLDDVITCSDNVTRLESGAATCGLKSGDRLTVEQALHFLLIKSANDAAVAIAEHISGTVDEFAVLMNKEAVSLGATNSNFVNPHGLNNEAHYSTAYDMYLITNAAIQYDKFIEIINMSEFTSEIKDASGEAKNITVKTSNKFLDGSYSAPEGITVIGGKTGTTAAAGSCLILVTKDSSSNTYISVILKSSERALLYEEMITLLEDINNS